MAQRAHALKKRISKLITCKYLLYLPQGYEETKRRWPVILFLHGAGERGNDLELVKKHGPPKIVETKDIPFIVISPQCPAGEWWSNDAVITVLDGVIARHRVDENRIYLTGLSMGGYGTWSVATAHPDRFAAIAPICGGGIPILLHKIKRIPAWVFHGAKDETVPLRESERMVAVFKACGGKVKFTVYPEAKHDSWTKTYANPRLYQWFLNHRRGGDKR